MSSSPVVPTPTERPRRGSPWWALAAYVVALVPAWFGADLIGQDLAHALFMSGSPVLDDLGRPVHGPNYGGLLTIVGLLPLVPSVLAASVFTMMWCWRRRPHLAVHAVGFGLVLLEIVVALVRALLIFG